jgi:nicotinamide-nucleotide amidase
MDFNFTAIDTLRQKLAELEQSIAVAESVTAGYLQAALASAENASEFFEGGITVYNIDQKVRHLGIDRKKGEACNCVSEETAEQMASGIVRLFKTDWGISVTGYATPVEESGGQVFCYFSICLRGTVVKTARVDLDNGTANEAQIQFVNHILNTFVHVISSQFS